METIYNIFIFFENDKCSTIGYKSHDHRGSDEESLDFLKSQLSDDFEKSQKVSISKPFTRAEYNAKCRLGEGNHLYDEVFIAVDDTNPAPLFIATPVKDGELFFHYSSKHGEFDINAVWAALGEEGHMEDWLLKYTNEDGIDLSRLIHDDYFLAIKLTFNAGLYVSAMKLLVSCIDSIAYIEYSNESGAFVRWLEAYADLSPLGITAAELWELRNGLLHMTNLNSKKVNQNKVRRISFRVGGPVDAQHGTSGEIYYFDFKGLILAFAEAQASWLDTYNVDRSKFDKFIERYDETISDSRVAFFSFGKR
jgi:hypothetical protein